MAENVCTRKGSSYHVYQEFSPLCVTLLLTTTHITDERVTKQSKRDTKASRPRCKFETRANDRQSTTVKLVTLHYIYYARCCRAMRNLLLSTEKTAN